MFFTLPDALPRSPHNLTRRQITTPHPTASDAMAQAAVHGYTTAFWWSAAIFAAGAIVCGLLIRPGTPQVDPAAEPVLAH